MATVVQEATDLELDGKAVQHSSPRDYWVLLKPNVMQLVVFTGGVGLFLAPGDIHPLLAFVTILCIAVGAGASAAINNWYDVDIDRVMARTRKRPTATGRIEPAEALGAGLTLAILSVLMLAVAVGLPAAGLLAFTIFFYTVIYTMGLKRRTPQNIVIGGAAGAFPPMIGWAAVTGDISIMPILLFLLIFFWTPPHFWALALYRTGDYERVGVPMLPVVAGAETTRRQIMGYSLILAVISVLPFFLGSAGWLYLATAIVMSGMFLKRAYRLLCHPSDHCAIGLFKFSIAYLFGLFLALVIDHALIGYGLLPGGVF
ncbi:MAG: heme o synthase [Geminicoccaceae bacterium]